MPPTYGIVCLTQIPNAVLFILNETDLTVLIPSLKKKSHHVLWLTQGSQEEFHAVRDPAIMGHGDGRDYST